MWGKSNKIEDIVILKKKTIRVISILQTLTHCKPLFMQLKSQFIIIFFTHNYTYTKEFLIVNLRKRCTQV